MAWCGGTSWWRRRARLRLHTLQACARHEAIYLGCPLSYNGILCHGIFPATQYVMQTCQAYGIQHSHHMHSLFVFAPRTNAISFMASPNATVPPLSPHSLLFLFCTTTHSLASPCLACCPPATVPCWSDMLSLLLALPWSLPVPVAVLPLLSNHIANVYNCLHPHLVPCPAWPSLPHYAESSAHLTVHYTCERGR